MKKVVKDSKVNQPDVIFRVVDIGSLTGEFIESQARTFPERIYVAVDPGYRDYSWFMRRDGNSERVESLKKAGVLLKAELLGEFIDSMLENNQKTREFRIDMPQPFPKRDDFSSEKKRREFLKENGISYEEWMKLFRNASNLLLPHGRILITSEADYFLEWLGTKANMFDLTAKRSPFSDKIPVESLRTPTMKRSAKEEYRRQEYNPGEDKETAKYLHRLIIRLNPKDKVPPSDRI